MYPKGNLLIPASHGQLEAIMQEDGPIVQPIWRNIFGAYSKQVQGFTMHPTAYIFGENLAIAKA